ncbi:uncharacterized protein N7484_002415 [Penicillium longicatenatum]|uniref:uncharacterized protein n=1 Tax=Penicillium longicatenatum TaxID=1561947 RepID=UPI002549B6AE|nr:uncharacterized protein N7484_002415 [Penicillium longicatenatum]KAJ5658766.1 hypothetical protein N7484_002415 [Penicillium longicatenatum]
MGSEMDTFAARLASFDVVLKPEKRRSSGVKGPRFIAWPHSKPSPAELAQAGFFYKPYESNPDNTTCFECGRALDGWEEEDNPITEHLKHSPDCGWAITMDIQQNSSNPSAIEDPTSERISQARLATFGSAWPHDEKRGWICQSEKMVEAGWYFCPTEESNDLASCAYCKLSLDGWEPKDDPFEEHYRRSSECSFFVFAQPPTKKSKGSKSKKSRVSKASSRLSTQSVGTTTSEAPEDLDESMDQSIMSQASVKSKATKKGAKGKGKSTKAKKEEAEAEDQMELDSVEHVQPEPEAPKTKRAGRGKKRVSKEMARDESESLAEPDQPSIEPPSKRRNTSTRSSSVSQTYNYEHEYEMSDAAPADEAPQEELKKSRKGSKKGTSKSRKASDVSVSSKSTSKSRLPEDSELDAAIEAGLEVDVPEQVGSEPLVEPEPEPELEVEPAPRASKKSKASKKTKPAKAAEQQAQELEEPMDYEEHPEKEPEVIAEPDVDAMELIEEQAEPAPKAKAAKGSKKKGTKKSKKEESKSKASASRESTQNKPTPDDQPIDEHHKSFVSVEIVNQQPEPAPEPEYQPEPQAEPEREPQPEPEATTPEKPVMKKSSKKEDKAKKSKKSKKKEPSPSPEPVVEETFEEPMPEQPVPVSPSADEEWGTPDDLPDQVEMVAPVEPSPEPSPEPPTKQRTPVPPKTVKRFSDIPQEEHLTEYITKPQESRGSMQRVSRGSKRSVSPLPPAHQHTPSMSPQSSDAENRPPSSRLSASRPAIPPAEPQDQTPRAAATPSPSKRNFNGAFAASNHPWTPVDIDEALFGEASDKENADLSGLFNGMKRGLTSPEKKMTVEEWIMWNAKNGEERLKRECERLVGQFEKEGSRGMQRLEAIECID